jgi:hypothetical protein
MIRRSIKEVLGLELRAKHGGAGAFICTALLSACSSHPDGNEEQTRAVQSADSTGDDDMKLPPVECAPYPCPQGGRICECCGEVIDCRNSITFCGNGICDPWESCDTCQRDCGTCGSRGFGGGDPGGGGGGSGGSGGQYCPPECRECDPFGDCIDS